jgi:hypothetical protein
MLVIQWSLGSGTVCSLSDIPDSTLVVLLEAEQKSTIRLLVK